MEIEILKCQNIWCLLNVQFLKNSYIIFQDLTKKIQFLALELYPIVEITKNRFDSFAH